MALVRQVWDELTHREREVIALAADGLTMAETADRLYVVTETAKYHRKNAIRKMGAANITHAVALGFRCGWLV